MKSSFKVFIVPLLIKWLGSLIVLTCRIRYVNDHAYREYLNEKKPFVSCLWHDCSTMAGWVMRNSPVTVVVSESRDGEYVSRFANLMGIKTIRGSTSRGAGKAVKAGLRVLRAGLPLAITPDGPRGPRYQFQHGALWFAAACQAPIIPVHIKASRAWELNSWDRQTFPKPFSSINVVFGDPINIERERLELELQSVVDQVHADMMLVVDAASRFA